MTWDAYHRRKELLREIFAIADRDRGFALTNLLDTLDPERLVLENETAALFEIQMAWFQRLSGHIDRLTTNGGETPEMVAIAAWTAAAADMPGARALLDSNRDAPALATAFAKERTFLAASAGVPMNHPDLGDQGERIISSARAEAASPATVLDEAASPATVLDEAASPATVLDEGADHVQPHGLIARLRQAIAA